MLSNLVEKVSEGYRQGKLARELLTEFRERQLNLWETENPASEWYQKVEPLRRKLSFVEHVGVVLGQMRHPLEWYRNAAYHFGGLEYQEDHGF